MVETLDTREQELSIDLLMWNPGFTNYFPRPVWSRLDFLEFELDGGSAVDLPCNRDVMEIFTGDGAASLGIGKICGKNTGQHIIIPVR